MRENSRFPLSRSPAYGPQPPSFGEGGHLYPYGRRAEGLGGEVEGFSVLAAFLPSYVTFAQVW